MTTGEQSAFNDHVRHFGTQADRVRDVLTELKRLLQRRMQRRGLLTAPPAYLGYPAPTWDPDSFEDLLHGCYSFSFASRMTGLKNKLDTDGDIRGVITRNVDNFLTTCQRKHDPIGYAVFGNVETAVRSVVGAGRGRIDPPGDGRIQNTTILVFAGAAGDVIAISDLHTRFADGSGWSAALPALVVTSEEGPAWLLSVLDRFAAAGVGAVRVGDLVSVVAEQAREDWSRLHATPADEVAFEGDGKLGGFVRLAAAASLVEDRDQWDRLKAVIAQRIEGIGRQERVRQRLASVFEALVGFIERGETGAGIQAEIGRAINLPKSSVSDAFRELEALLEDMRPSN